MRPLLTTRVSYFCLSLIILLPAFVDSLPGWPPAPDCQAPEKVTVTVTAAATGSPQHYPSWYHGSSITSSSSTTPKTGLYPVPSGVDSCFNRKEHAFIYSYDHGYQFAGMGGKPNIPTAKSSTLWTAKPTPLSANVMYSLSTISEASGTPSTPALTNSFVKYNSTTSFIPTGNYNTSLSTKTTVLYSNSSTIPTTTSSTAVNSTTSTSSCEPLLQLNDVLENGFNKKNSIFSISITNHCQFDPTNTTVFANFAPITNITIKPDAITISGLTSDYVLLSLFALTKDGTPVFKSYQLHFGSISMPIFVQDTNGQPVNGVFVSANATAYPGLGESCITDGTGRCSLDNLPSTTISLVAKTSDNSIAVNGLAATNTLVTLTLSPFIPPATNTTYIVENGTTGWTGGTQSQAFKLKRDTTLVVSTGGKYNLQTAQGRFSVHPFTKNVFIKYKFVTKEVPGGYFGTQFNDYYSVTIRSDTGASVSVTNSMNALGLGAFDANGATDWFTLTLSVPANTKSVDFDVGVSNVADNLLDSQVVVGKVGDLQCDQCGNCDTCPTDPMCQDICKTPQEKSCAFYRSCAEAQLGCGDTGYPIAKGDKNCNRFGNNLKWFTASGQNFVWGTMHCLQTAMVPVLQSCKATCSSFEAAAFASHPACYVANGFCGLQCPDVLVVFMTVYKDLIDPESLKQVALTAVGCKDNLIQTLTGCTGDIVFGAAAGGLSGGGLAGIAKGIAIKVIKKYLSSF